VAPVFASALAPVFVPHRRPGPMRRGRLVSRPNRFLGIVALDPAADGGGTDGGALEIEAHIGDRGRLVDILFPGAEVYVVPAAGPTRRTAYTLVCARCPPLEKGGQGPEIPPLCCLDPAFANRLVLALLQARALSGKGGLPEYGDIRPEVRVGASRFDFALALPATDGEGERRLLLEVKSAAAAKGRAAIFPDAPSLRAVRHTRELAALSRQGQKAAIVMLSQRADIAEIRPHPVDPLFAAALLDAQEAGVCLLGVAFEVRLDGFHYAGTRPVIPHIT
jgi:sugar fermentation stimulation protein A